MVKTPDYEGSLALLHEEYLAALHEFLSDRTLTPSTRRAGMSRLKDEYLRRRAPERQAIRIPLAGFAPRSKG
jgi:hypothetical protein